MHKNIIINHVHHITQNVILLKMYSFLPKEDCKKGTQNDVFKDLNQVFFISLYKTNKTSIYM